MFKETASANCSTCTSVAGWRGEIQPAFRWNSIQDNPPTSCWVFFLFFHYTRSQTNFQSPLSCDKLAGKRHAALSTEFQKQKLNCLGAGFFILFRCQNRDRIPAGWYNIPLWPSLYLLGLRLWASPVFVNAEEEAPCVLDPLRATEILSVKTNPHVGPERMQWCTSEAQCSSGGRQWNRKHIQVKQ